MKKDNTSLAAAFMPALCMALLMGFEALAERGKLPGGLSVAAAVESAVFLVPFGILLLLRRLCGQEKPALRLGRAPRHTRSFTLFLSLATPIGAFLLNCLVGALGGQAVGKQQGALALQQYMGGQGIWLALVVTAVLPAFAEELFFRSALQGFIESAGTGTAILFTSLSFAMVHGSPSNFAGPLAAGMVFGYLSAALGSVWPAVFAHLVSNLYAWGIAYFSEVYEAFSLWNYFVVANVVCFCILLYLAMRSLEKLIEKGQIPRFKRGGTEKTVFTFLSPGFLLLVLLFFLESFYL